MQPTNAIGYTYQPVLHPDNLRNKSPSQSIA